MYNRAVRVFLAKMSNGMLEDCSSYLDERMYVLESNKMISGPEDVTQVYLVRKVSDWSEKKELFFFFLARSRLERGRKLPNERT